MDLESESLSSDSSSSGNSGMSDKFIDQVGLSEIDEEEEAVSGRNLAATTN